MDSALGEPVEATLIDPGPAVYDKGLGARIEVPVTRAIVSMFRLATLDDVIPNWSVFLDSPVDPGDYEIVWRTSDAEPPFYETYVPLNVAADSSDTSTSGGAGSWPAIDRAAVTPDVSDVAALERTRTYNDSGVDQGTFNQNTRPTDSEVDGLIEQAADDILGVMRGDLDPYYYNAVKGAITRQAALYVEGSYFRDNINSDLVSMYRNDIRASLQALGQSATSSGAWAGTEGHLRLT